MRRRVPLLAMLALACSNQGAPLQGIPGETGGSTVWRIRAFGQTKPTAGAADTRASGTRDSPLL